MARYLHAARKCLVSYRPVAILTVTIVVMVLAIHNEDCFSVAQTGLGSSRASLSGPRTMLPPGLPYPPSGQFKGIRAHLLSRDLVELHASSNHLVVTWSDWDNRDFVRNWVYHLHKAGCSALLVGATDTQLLEWLFEAGIPAFLIEQKSPARVSLLRAFSELGTNVILSDVDAVWLRDPIPFMQMYPDADILASSDAMEHGSPSEKLESSTNLEGPASLAVLFMRPSARKFIMEWESAIPSDGRSGERAAFNDLFHRELVQLTRRNDNLASVFRGTLLGGILSTSAFCSGQAYRAGLQQRIHVRPFVVHTPHPGPGEAAEKFVLRELGLWRDLPEHWTHPAGFLTYDNKLPATLWESAPRGALGELAAPLHAESMVVNHQLIQYRNAFIAARVLGGHSVVQPPVWLRGDLAARPKGGLAGTVASAPSAHIPVDAIIDLEALDKDAPNGYRESSFLRNPQGSGLLGDRLQVFICPDMVMAECETGDAVVWPLFGEVRLKPRRTLQQLRTALFEASKGYQVIEFKGNIADAMILSKEEVQRYSRWMAGWLSHPPSKLHQEETRYDLFWDYPGAAPQSTRMQTMNRKVDLGSGTLSAPKQEATQWWQGLTHS
uniref:Nucleotide-diphospho-sugar transferase domain-containing protein n=1 Tax=Auxenochlorella protothecoides TaxID=3075 RepID=A0A1D1ZMJ5_AUXPR